MLMAISSSAADELRHYLESSVQQARRSADRFGALGPGPAAKLCRATKRSFRARRARRTGCGSWTNMASSWRFSTRRRWATCRAIREPDYAVALCEAYNDYVYDHYAKVSDRLKPIAMIPPQDPERAAIELRRAVKQLGYRAAVVRTTGLRLPLGHQILRSDLPRSGEFGLRHRRPRHQRRRRACFGRIRDFHRSSHGVFSSGNLRAVFQHDFSGSAGAISKTSPGFSGDRLHLVALLAGPHGRTLGEARQDRDAAS